MLTSCDKGFPAVAPPGGALAAGASPRQMLRIYAGRAEQAEATRARQVGAVGFAGASWET